MGIELPHDIDAEEFLLSCAFLDGADVLQRCLDAGIGEGSFYDVRNGKIFAVLADLHRRGLSVEAADVFHELKRTRRLDEIGGQAFFSQVSGRVPTTAQVSTWVARVSECAVRRRVIMAAAKVAETAREWSGIDVSDLLEDVSTEIARATTMQSCGSVIAELAPRRAGFGRVVPKQVPVISLAGTPIFTRGNVGTVTAQKKSGKTSMVGGLMAALVGGPNCSGDTLHFGANNQEEHAVIHFDTEQATEDHERLIRTVLARVNRDAPPWLYSYGLKGFGVLDLGRTLDRLLKEASKRHGGICAVILDGVADFVSDPNAADECNPFVTRLEAIATGYNCSLIGVLHLNPDPGSRGAKSRGHLGSQLERKCETDVRLVQDKDGITTMFTACARRAPILEKDGPRFSWDKAAGMHLSLSTTKSTAREDEERESLRELAADAFSDRESMRWGDLISTVKTTAKTSDRTAERKVAAMKLLGVIRYCHPNHYTLAP